MLMSPGTTFTGVSGVTYSSSVNPSEIGPADVRLALINGWTELPYPAGAPSGSAVPVYGMNVVTATLAATQNDYNGGGSTVTDTMVLTPASGGSVITGFDVATLGGKVAIKVRNASATDSIQVPHLSTLSKAGNRVSNTNGVTAVIPPLSGSILSYDNGVFTFLS
jgi:hypothetical protein